MNTYIAFCIQFLTFVTLLAGSAITLLYLYSKYGKSPQLIIGVIICTWITLVVNVILSIFGLRTMLDELLAHPAFTATSIICIHIAILAFLLHHATITMRVVSLCSWFIGIVILYHLYPVSGYGPIISKGELVTAFFMLGGLIAQVLAQIFADDNTDKPETSSSTKDDTHKPTNPIPAQSPAPQPIFSRHTIWQRHQPSQTPINTPSDIVSDCTKKLSETAQDN